MSKEFVEAVRKNDLAIVKDGIDVGFEVDLVVQGGTSLLMIAAQEGHYEMCELLLKNGAKVNAINVRVETALMLAAEKNKLQICKLLVSNGATVGKCSLLGETALLMAARTKNYELIEFLLSKGSDINRQDEDGNTILHLVIPCSNQLVQFLINSGVDIDLTNDNGFTALMYACSMSNLGNALTLAQAGAEFQVGYRCAWAYANQQVTDHLTRHGFIPHNS